MPQKPRAILYVDGFNLYHPIDKLGANHLKWLDLQALGNRICQDRGHALVGVVYCTAYRVGDVEKVDRHKKYVEALESTGIVRVERGHYITQDTEQCKNCGVVGTKQTEKQTDINLALSIYSDARCDRFDWAYMLSADSDHAATARFLKLHFPEKMLVTVSPPNKEISPNIMNYADGKRRLNREDIEKCRFPSIIFRVGQHPIRCPKKYELPT